MLLFFAILIAAVAAVIGGATYYVAGVPGWSYRGPLPPLTDDERALATRLKGHVVAIASREHNVAHYDELEKSARYIETTLAAYGYAVDRQSFAADDGVSVRYPLPVNCNDCAIANAEPAVPTPTLTVFVLVSFHNRSPFGP